MRFVGHVCTHEKKEKRMKLHTSKVIDARVCSRCKIRIDVLVTLI